MGTGIFGSLVSGLRRLWKGTDDDGKSSLPSPETETRPLLLTPELRVNAQVPEPEHHAELLEAEPDQAIPPKKEKIKKPGKKQRLRQTHTDKNEIPILTDQHDLYQLFDEPGTKQSNQKIKQIRNQNRKKARKSKDKRNKHLQDTIVEDFEQLLEESKTDQYHSQMLEEKKDACEKEDTASIRIWELFSEYPPPQVELDLHGYTASQAESGTERFIRTSREKGYMTIRLIVGKGTHSQGKAILPDVVEKKVICLKRKKRWILGYQWEKKDKRKSGSLIVYLIPT